MLRIVVLVALSACSFSKELPEEVGVDGGVTPNPGTERCQGSGMVLCIDFEGDPIVKDAFGASVSARDITAFQREATEQAADLQPMSYAQIHENANLNLGAFTVEMWTRPGMKPPKMDDQQVGLFDAVLQYQMNYEWDGKIECRIFDVSVSSDNVDSGATVEPGGWHHVACTYDNAELRVYVDGVLSACVTTNRAVSSNGYNAVIGANMVSPTTFKNHFVGQLDNVHLYERALAAPEICDMWGYGSCESAVTCDGGNGSYSD